LVIEVINTSKNDSEKNKVLLTYVSIGLVVGVLGAVIVTRKRNKSSNIQPNAKLDAEMQNLFTKIKEAKK
jgi:uncharacterized membrane-anchored protein YhcB (DUF1043 family)